MNFVKFAIVYMEKSRENSLANFRWNICLRLVLKNKRTMLAVKKMASASPKRRKNGSTMADDKVDWFPTTDINTPLGIPLLIDRYGDRRTAGQLVDDRNVIICGAGMDAAAPFHHYPPPWHPSRPPHHLTLANPPSGSTIRAGC